MKYFTKEFYATEWLSFTNQFVKRSKSAEREDESFFRRMYEKHYALYEHNQRMSYWYRDPEEDMRKIEAYVNEPGITEAERNYRKEFQKIHEQVQGNWKNKTVYEFNEEICKQQFEEQINARIENYKRLPREILEKIADIRVFSLGYASAEVKRLLRGYCAELRREVRTIKEKAYKETDEAERLLSKKIGLNELEDFLIMSLEEKNGDLYLKNEYDSYLLIKDGKIIEGKDKTIYPYDEEKPNYPWSRVLATELHRVDGKFELHFLVENSNEIDKVDLWYLTLQGSDIIDLSPENATK